MLWSMVMSTKERYGSAVWQAVKDRDTAAVVDDIGYWFTVANIASRAEVSVPTARKYLRELVDMGLVARIGDNRTTLYALVKDIE